MLVNVGSERPAVSDWASALSWGRDEAELVHELQAGSETAFDWLVTHYHAPVYNLSLSVLGDTSDAADGSQEVFLKTWLYGIAIAEARNQKRGFSAPCRRMFLSMPNQKRGKRASKSRIFAPRLSSNSLLWKFKWRFTALCGRFPRRFAARSFCAT